MTFRRTGYPYLVCTCALLLGFQPVQAETLEGAVHSALSHPSIEAAQAGLEAAKDEKREEFSGWFPEVSVNGTGGRIYGDNATSRGFTTTRGAAYSYYWDGQVMARQTIFDGFETPNRIRAAGARKQSADMVLTDIRESLGLRAAQAYLNVMRTHTGLNMLQVQQKAVHDYMNRIKSSVDSGTSDEAEYQQARDVNAILDGFIADYEGQVRAAESDFFEVTGRMPQGEMQVPQPNINQLPLTVDEALEISRNAHPSLMAAQYSSRSAGYDIQSEKAQLYPDVNGELSYLKSEKEDVIGGEVVDAKAVVRMNWNLETGGAQLARIRKKKHEHQESLAQVEELQRQIERNVRLSYSELETAQELYENSKVRQELNGKLFDTYKIQFEGARITLLQMMQADNQLFNTRLEKMNGEYRVLAAQYAALASMGRLQGSLNLASSETGPQSHEQK